MTARRIVRELALAGGCAIVAVSIWPLPAWRIALAWLGIILYVTASSGFIARWMWRGILRREHDDLMRAIHTQGPPRPGAN